VVPALEEARVPLASTLIVGSGPAAVGAALALSRRPDLGITVLDIGLELDADRNRARDVLSHQQPDEWAAETLAVIASSPARSKAPGLPEKRVLGSDFPFRNVGQLDGLSTADDVNRSVISGAYGGFSNVWGAQLMPFSAATFEAWPAGLREMEEHYRAILDVVPFAAEPDDLAEHFPLIGRPVPLPEVSSRTKRVLAAYRQSRSSFADLGITIGKARLALAAQDCVRSGRCMTGCPYSLIYSASQTFDSLRAAGRVTYRSGLMVLRVAEEGDAVVVFAKEMATGQMHQFRADRVYLAAGAIGTTRIVANSLGWFDSPLSMIESQQFVVPMLSFWPTPDPRTERMFTLNQFNMTISLDDDALDLSQIHFYTYDPTFINALPGVLRARAMERVLGQVLRRLSVGIGYLPSWHSPRLEVTVRQPATTGALPAVEISRVKRALWRDPMFRTVMTRLARSARKLDLYPVVPAVQFAGGAKSYHVGGSFPHRDVHGDAASSDRMGRVGPWRRIHLIDAAVFPTIPATTFTLTIMANAHRIAHESTAA
jgi:choline dehydrogenase-like flavoprotein